MPPGARPPNVPRTPLVAPVEYFGQHDRPSLSRATGVVLVEGLATALVLWLFMQRVIARVDVTPAELLLLVSFLGTCWKAAIQGHGLAESQGMAPEKALVLTVVVGLAGFLLGLA